MLHRYLKITLMALLDYCKMHTIVRDQTPTMH